MGMLACISRAPSAASDPIDDKPSLTLDFARFRPRQSFRGWPKVHLNNSVEDASYLRDELGSQLFRAAGVPAPELGHATVKLNGRRLGLYVVKQGFTSQFLRSQFGEEGVIFEPTGTRDINEPMKAHPAALNSGRAAIARLSAAAAESDLERRWAMLRRALDMDRFISFIALEVMLGHWDGYALAHNNYRVAYLASSDTLVFVPSGMDQLFANAALPWRPQMAGLVARAVLETPAGRAAYAARFKDLLETRFVPAQLSRCVRNAVGGLDPLLTSFEFADVQREARELCVRVAARENNLRMQLSQVEPCLVSCGDEPVALTAWHADDQAPATHKCSKPATRKATGCGRSSLGPGPPLPGERLSDCLEATMFSQERLSSPRSHRCRLGCHRVLACVWLERSSALQG